MPCHRWLKSEEVEEHKNQNHEISEYPDEYFEAKDKMTYKEWLKQQGEIQK